MASRASRTTIWVIPVVDSAEIEDRSLIPEPGDNLRLRPGLGRSAGGCSKGQLDDEPLQRRVVLEDQRVDPPEGAQPSEVEESLHFRRAEKEIAPAELELPGRVIRAVGLETEFPVVVEILDEERVVEIDHHRQIVSLREIVVPEMAVEQDPVVAIGLGAEGVRNSLNDIDGSCCGFGLVGAVRDGQGHAVAGLAQNLGEGDETRPDPCREPADRLRADHEDPAQKTLHMERNRKIAFMSGW